DAAHRDAFPHQGVAPGIDEVDVHRALGVAVHRGPVVPERHGDITAVAVAVVVRVVDVGNGVHVGALLHIGVDVEPQVRVVLAVAVATGLHLGPGRGFHAATDQAGVAFAFDRQRRI